MYHCVPINNDGKCKVVLHGSAQSLPTRFNMKYTSHRYLQKYHYNKNKRTRPLAQNKQHPWLNNKRSAICNGGFMAETDR